MRSLVRIAAVAAASLALAGCGTGDPSGPATGTLQPEHEEQYGIYSFDQVSGEVNLIYSSEIPIRKISQDPMGDEIVFR